MPAAPTHVRAFAEQAKDMAMVTTGDSEISGKTK